MQVDDSDSCPCLNPDPDIAGIGAIISFISTAEPSREKALLVAIQYIYKSSPEVAQRRFETARERFTSLFFPLVFTLGDTQLITGLAVLISGWIRLRAGLSVYHFTVIADLAWMASDTQLVAFFALFQCVRSTPHWRRDALDIDIEPYVYLPSRLCRAFGMLCMFTMLFVASVILSDRAWWDCVSLPAIGFFSHLNPGGSRLVWSIFNYSMLIWGYSAALIPLFRPTYRAYEAIKCAIMIIIPCGGAWPHRARQILRGVQEFLVSMVFDAVFTAIWFGIGTWSIISDRAQGSDVDLCTADNTEAEWGFGQLVPMVLLGLPLLGALDAYGKHSKSGGGPALPHLGSTRSRSGSEIDLLVGPRRSSAESSRPSLGQSTLTSAASADFDHSYDGVPLRFPSLAHFEPIPLSHSGLA
ncbi:hypothetical protein MVEN_01417000 [Mycena venus]|uniref:Uncharacterized protein n=1 Tax=Mycena venus TaxID=2733690 RepID=A0A8H6XVI7_9AGAR|nr:hypothetical protein MVEN_01417000 [Mycena venus]